MPTTPNRSLPYPGLNEAPDGPAAVAALALAVDTDLQELFTRLVPGQLLARMIRTSTSAVGSGSILPWSSAPHNPYSNWSGAANTRFVAHAAGWHTIGGHLQHGTIASSTGLTATVKVGGVDMNPVIVAANSSPSGTSIPIDESVYLTVGQYVELVGGNALASATSYAGSVLTVHYAGA